MNEPAIPVALPLPPQRPPEFPPPLDDSAPPPHTLGTALDALLKHPGLVWRTLTNPGRAPLTGRYTAMALAWYDGLWSRRRLLRGRHTTADGGADGRVRPRGQDLRAVHPRGLLHGRLAPGALGYLLPLRPEPPACRSARAQWSPHRTLLAWILTTGLVGTQCSWFLSPVVKRPTSPVTFWNPLALEGNFFEYLWEHVVRPELGGDLTGWYRLPNRHFRTRDVLEGPGTLIPVFKRSGVYYSVCRGMEVPLMMGTNGLSWGFTPSSMAGTRIGRDDASGAIYIVIEDANARYEGDYSTSGEQQFMERILKPAGMLDPAAPPPRTHADFQGCYVAVWFPYYRWVVGKTNDRYHLDGQLAERDGWKSEASEAATLEPLPDGLGFQWGRRQENRLIFNRDLHRYEYTSPDGSVRMPLARVATSLPPGKGFPSPPIEIGIPSWH